MKLFSTNNNYKFHGAVNVGNNTFLMALLITVGVRCALIDLHPSLGVLETISKLLEFLIISALVKII